MEGTHAEVLGLNADKGLEGSAAAGRPDFQWLFEAAPSLFLVLTPGLHITAASDAYLRATMVEREAILGRYIFDVFPDNPGGSSNESTVRASLLRVLANKAPDALAVLKYDIPRPASEGGGFEERYWSALNSPVLGDDGEVVYIIHRVEDVTEFVRLRKLEADEKRIASELQLRLERVETEILLRARELEETARALERSNAALAEAKREADAANRAKSSFLASMSHEIRTPLNGVIGNLELLSQMDLTQDQEDLLLDADKAAKSLLALIGNVLDFSKIEAGKFDLERVNMNPAAVVHECVNIVQSQARQKGTFVTASIGVDVPELIVGDPGRLRQVLLNLLGNAVKFTDTGGVHVRVKSTGGEAQQCELHFEVHDSGRGFDAAIAAELFEPFTQDHKKASDSFEGTGLGLSISKRLVEAWDGRIGTESQPGDGASFFFTMPTAVVRPAHSPEKPSLFGRTILLLPSAREDEPEELVRYFAERRAVILRATPAEAMGVAETAADQGRPADIAFLIARTDGGWDPELSLRLREQRAIPILYAGDDSPETWRRALRAGVAYVVGRDFDGLAMDRNIQEIIGAPGQQRRQILDDPESVADTRQSLAGHKLLVLEDRLVNQRVVHRQLRALGIEAVVAANGREGLQRLEQEAFDLVLSDCSMPEMNGYDFTRALRRLEAEKGKPRLRVIAMTANAFREDIEKCFAAGMDDFVSKPVTLNRLATVLERWLAPGSSSAAAPDAAATDCQPVVIAQLEELLGSAEPELVSDVLRDFEVCAGRSWDEISAAVADGNDEMLKAAAHGAKGEARNAGAETLGGLYARLEQCAHASDSQAVKELLPQITQELARVRSFIADHLRLQS